MPTFRKSVFRVAEKKEERKTCFFLPSFRKNLKKFRVPFFSWILHFFPSKRTHTIRHLFVRDFTFPPPSSRAGRSLDDAAAFGTQATPRPMTSTKDAAAESAARTTPTTPKRARDEEGFLWRLVTDHPNIFETHVVTKLNGNDVKFFYDVNTESRRAIQNSKARLRDAFEIGDFDTKSTLSWALEKCSEKKERFCAQMALNGNVELLKFLHENGCPWDDRTCTSAAAGGLLECLKYAHENECPWG